MNPYRTVTFYTLGCKLNFSETSAISRLFEDGGYAKVDFEERPDIFVINTCSVTDNADKKCRYLVRKARKINPNAFIIMLGCYAQLKPKEISEIEGVNMVLGANDKFNVIEHLEKIEEKLKNNTDLFGREFKYKKIELDESFPEYILRNKTKFNPWII